MGPGRVEDFGLPRGGVDRHAVEAAGASIQTAGEAAVRAKDEGVIVVRRADEIRDVVEDDMAVEGSTVVAGDVPFGIVNGTVERLVVPGAIDREFAAGLKGVVERGIYVNTIADTR